MDFGHVKKETISRFPQVSKKYFNPHSDEENGCSKNGGIQNKKKKKKLGIFVFKWDHDYHQICPQCAEQI